MYLSTFKSNWCFTFYRLLKKEWTEKRNTELEFRRIVLSIVRCIWIFSWEVKNDIRYTEKSNSLMKLHNKKCTRRNFKKPNFWGSNSKMLILGWYIRIYATCRLRSEKNVNDVERDTKKINGNGNKWQKKLECSVQWIIPYSNIEC